MKTLTAALTAFIVIALAPNAEARPMHNTPRDVCKNIRGVQHFADVYPGRGKFVYDTSTSRRWDCKRRTR